jgi:hypothetical protein
MTAAANWVTGSGLRYPRAYRPNRAGRQCWANFAIEAWKSPEEPPEKLCLYYSNPCRSRKFFTPPQPSPNSRFGSKKFTNDLGLLYCTVADIKGNTVKFIRVNIRVLPLFQFTIYRSRHPRCNPRFIAFNAFSIKHNFYRNPLHNFGETARSIIGRQ